MVAHACTFELGASCPGISFLLLCDELQMHECNAHLSHGHRPGSASQEGGLYTILNVLFVSSVAQLEPEDAIQPLMFTETHAAYP